MPPRAPRVQYNLLGEPVTIIPRQPGETVYAYRQRRSVALTGETLYQRRIRQGRARGFTTTEARGQQPGESLRRREQTLRQYGVTPWQLWRSNQMVWLTDNGFTPLDTGWSWNRLIRIAPRLRWLNEHSSPGGQITPDMMRNSIDMEDAGELEKDWTWERINEKYSDSLEYYQTHHSTMGNFHWFQDRIPDMELAWWYYHTQG